MDENPVDHRNENIRIINNTSQASSSLRDTTIREKILNDLEIASTDMMAYCSRFEVCNAPLCPLDPLIDKRISQPGDEKCSMPKSTRHKYWITMPEDLKRYLPYEGYFKAEFSRIKASQERWNNLSTEERLKIIERGRLALSRANNARR